MEEDLIQNINYILKNKLVEHIQEFLKQEVKFNITEDYLVNLGLLKLLLTIDEETNIFNITNELSVLISNLEAYKEGKLALNFMYPEKLTLENISSENSLLGILLETVEDSDLAKTEVIEKVKQELKQLEEEPVVNELKNNSLITVHELEEGV